MLLNLLIARFAKTFDMVYDNLDSNFNVAFARLVIEAGNKPLLPPPLNLLRGMVLSCYFVSGWVWGHLQSCARGVYSTLDDEANDEDAEAAREQCIKVQQFIEKAI